MIKFTHVYKQYPGSTTYSSTDLNFTINQGEFVYIVGESGMGKTTLLEMMYGVQKPTKGSIYVNKYQTPLHRKQLPMLRRTLGIVFQDYESMLNPVWTVNENIAYAMYVIGRNDQYIQQHLKKLLQAVGLTGKGDKQISQLSGGEQQRVAVARAISNNPRVIIADEPTGNLDPKTAEQITRIFEAFNKYGITVIMATHNDAIVNKHPHRIIELDHGRIIRDQQNGQYFRQQAVTV